MQCLQHVTCFGGCCDASLVCGATQRQPWITSNIRKDGIEFRDFVYVCMGDGGGGRVMGRVEHDLQFIRMSKQHD